MTQRSTRIGSVEDIFPKLNKAYEIAKQMLEKGGHVTLTIKHEGGDNANLRSKD